MSIMISMYSQAVPICAAFDGKFMAGGRYALCVSGSLILL